ncbi:hypothetical protein DLM45_12235 [Hyphomicrobium methylovorum]|uniref:VWA domain-containing protein n=1 Tax=Hyphomicrobium methylovorum TaxID=84 RepID=UPI0015E72757|nr:hypothetical protein [Hyphomicrobium methylovorum]
MGNARKLIGFISAALLSGSSAVAEFDKHPMSSCIEDAMLVFDASGSMSGIDAYSPGSSVTRIDDARNALAQSLPHVTPQRRLGLITYGPGGHCHFTLNLRPAFNAAPQIMTELTGISPDGRTPLTSSVAEAANVLDYRNKAAVIVLLTDGAETCGGEPCKLAKALNATAKAITIHVVGYRMKDMIESNERDIGDMKCLAAATGGRFIGVDSIPELVDALNSTLGCPVFTQMDTPFSRLIDRTGQTITN